MKIYAISGLGADKRVFDYLSLEGELISLDWIEPLKGESLSSYSMRLASGINKNEPFCLLGVSFGGLVAVEISKFMNPILTILISSASTKDELPAAFRLLGKIGVVKVLPSWLFRPPRYLAYPLFGTRHELLGLILKDTDVHFAKWAVNELLVWKQEERLDRVFKVHGTKDYLIPALLVEGDISVSGGGHFMIVDRADEVSAAINSKFAEI